jgi:acetone carboxylase, alpha subunit
MNSQAFTGATYSTQEMGMTFELAGPGELYMMCQGAGGGYGDVLQRDPAAVMKDIEDDLISHGTAREIYKLVFDERTLIPDVEATAAARAGEREARLQRGKPYDEFVREWQTAEPPADLPYFGSWDDPRVIYGTTAGQRVKMDADKLVSMYMLNPKDVRIAQLEAELKAARSNQA